MHWSGAGFPTAGKSAEGVTQGGVKHTDARGKESRGAGANDAGARKAVSGASNAPDREIRWVREKTRRKLEMDAGKRPEAVPGSSEIGTRWMPAF